MQHIKALVAAEFTQVNELIVRQLHSNVPLAENIGYYLIEAGGKRLRPLLALLAAGSVGTIQPAHIALAGVIEFIHTSTLLHDDVVDVSTLRRGRPTANAKWGNASSVLVGDFLYSRAFQMLVELDSMPLMRLMADTTNTIAEGEVLQLTKAGNPDTSEAAYLEVIERKTAVLFAAAARGAAMLSNADDTAGDSLYRYGLHLGIAFQMADDALDYRGDADTMGKNVGDDLGEGKPTLPLIHILKTGSAEEKALVTQAITERDSSRLPDILRAIERTGALDYTLDRAREQSQLAAAAIAELGDSRHVEAMLSLAELAVNRDS
ncbi:MAG: polyprenyl synthetase family protein [Spongiibacteraceae bacterium]|jgi:octaprenyl-diphosphate synthase|nr:polyprenyl synthetase family protein [Spongiibacteraceae bacterium]